MISANAVRVSAQLQRLSSRIVFVDAKWSAHINVATSGHYLTSGLVNIQGGVCSSFTLTSVFANYSTYRKARNNGVKANIGLSLNKHSKADNIDDLKAIWKDKSLSLSAKFKVLFRQYGLVLVVVHLITAVFWMGMFYLAVSWGFDIVPFLEKHGIFNFLERIGLPASDKLKSPGASNLLAAYLLYELAKPIRYPVTILGTIYAVRILRKLNYLKSPPKANTTVRELVSTRNKIARHQFRKTTSKYRERFAASRLKRKSNIKKNGHHNNKSSKNP